MPMYHLKEYSNIYSKATGSLWQHCRDEPALNGLPAFDFPAGNNNSALFKLETKITSRTGNGLHKRC